RRAANQVNQHHGIAHRRGPLTAGQAGPYHFPVALVVVVIIRRSSTAAAGRTPLLVIGSFIDHTSAIALRTSLRHVTSLCQEPPRSGLRKSQTATPTRPATLSDWANPSGNTSISATSRTRQRRSYVGFRSPTMRKRGVQQGDPVPRAGAHPGASSPAYLGDGP